MHKVSADRKHPVNREIIVINNQAARNARMGVKTLV